MFCSKNDKICIQRDTVMSVSSSRSSRDSCCSPTATISLKIPRMMLSPLWEGWASDDVGLVVKECVCVEVQVFGIECVGVAEKDEAFLVEVVSNACFHELWHF